MEDIDKRIKMPDVDAEWKKFEHEVIDKDAKLKFWRVVACLGGMGIAVTMALLFVLNPGKDERKGNPILAQKPALISVPTDSLRVSKSIGKTGLKLQRSKERQTKMLVAPSSLGMGTNAMRIAGSESTKRHSDSVVVILDGVIQPDSVSRELLSNPYVVINRQHQIIDRIMVYKDESSRKHFADTYGLQSSHLAVIEITTLPDTLSETYMRQHPEIMQHRRRVEGFVKCEDGHPMADAWIFCKDWSMGTATDSNGHFVIWIPRGISALNVHHDGYRPIHNVVPADTILDIRMNPHVSSAKTKEGVSKQRFLRSIRSY